jgi:two-component system cell cycle sensor histidine kinase/response regulator CckA
MSDQPVSSRFERIDAAGDPARVMLVAAIFCGAVVGFLILPAGDAAKLATALLALLAVIGVVAVFALAAGLFRFDRPDSVDKLARAMCDGNPEAMMATDPWGGIVYCNEAFKNLWGDPAPADLRSIERLFAGAPGASDAVYRLAQAASAGRTATEAIRLNSAPDGGTRTGWRKVKVTPLAVANGRCASLWTFTDAGGESDRPEAVAQEQVGAIDLLDHAPAGFLACAPDGAVVYMNATLAAWLDYEPAAAGSARLALSDLIAGDAGALLAAGQEFDLDLKRRGGGVLPARLLHRAAFGRVGAAALSRTLVLSRATGATPNAPAGEIQFTRVFNAAPMAIAIVDSSGRIARSNAAFARLMPDALKPAGDGAGRSIYSAIGEGDRAALRAALTASAETRTDIAPLDVALAGDSDRSARLFISATDAGEGTGATIYALETTEQRALQTNFAQSQKMQAIGQLAGGVAHDFNNVLTAIIGYSDLLLANHRPTDPAFRDIMQIKQNANRAAGLVRQLLAFSRRQTLRPQVLQLGDVLSDLQMLMRRLVGEKINLELRHGRDLWLVKADSNQFEQVIVNLIVNARDAMPDGGQIILRTRNVTPLDCAGFEDVALPAADYVAVEVEDFGHGIAPEVKDKIFEPFFTTKEVGKGTGLGLAMVYGIVKQTGGYVFCASAVGHGSTFTVLLPRHIAGAGDAPPLNAPARPAADLTGHGTILLVEDEEAVRAFAARALASRGYRVLQAASGLEALEIAARNEGKIDLVVSDVVMPEMDGPTMFGELRKRGVTAKVIFVSGYAEEAFAKNLPEGEDFAFLPKPFSLKQLIEAVKAAAV